MDRKLNKTMHFFGRYIVFFSYSDFDAADVIVLIIPFLIIRLELLYIFYTGGLFYKKIMSNGQEDESSFRLIWW